MKTTVSQYDFTEAFRTIRPDNFSYQGLRALFDWVEELDDDCGTETELDVIAFCCEFSEYEDLADFQANYGEEYADLDAIREQTTVIEIGDGNLLGSQGFIVQDF